MKQSRRDTDQSFKLWRAAASDDKVARRGSAQVSSCHCQLLRIEDCLQAGSLSRRNHLVGRVRGGPRQVKRSPRPHARTRRDDSRRAGSALRRRVHGYHRRAGWSSGRRANFFQVSSASRARCEAALRLTAIFISCLRLCLAIGAWSASGRAISVSAWTRRRRCSHRPVRASLEKPHDLDGSASP